MAWTGNVRRDRDKPDVGFATAIWNEGEADEFRYSRRATVSGAEAAAFVAEAVAARDAYIAQAAANASLSATLTMLLNNAEA